MRVLKPAILGALLLAALAMPFASPRATTKHTKHASRTFTATPSCEFPAERAAFDVEGLKSQLMVTALACRMQDKYNAFMSRYQPEVAHEERDLNGFFKRTAGRSAQKAYDDYISNLANTQEQDGIKAGTAFCDNLPTMFDEVLALHDASELRDYANAKTIAQPVTFEMCAAQPAPAAKPSRHRTKHA